MTSKLNHPLTGGSAWFFVVNSFIVPNNSQQQAVQPYQTTCQPAVELKFPLTFCKLPHQPCIKASK